MNVDLNELSPFRLRQGGVQSPILDANSCSDPLHTNNPFTEGTTRWCSPLLVAASAYCLSLFRNQSMLSSDQGHIDLPPSSLLKDHEREVLGLIMRKMSWQERVCWRGRMIKLIKWGSFQFVRTVGVAWSRPAISGMWSYYWGRIIPSLPTTYPHLLLLPYPSPLDHITYTCMVSPRVLLFNTPH